MERITAATPECDRRGHEFRYRLAAGFCEPGDTIVDAACGVGYGAELLLAGRDIEYFGFDRNIDDVPMDSPASVAFAQIELESWESHFDFDVFVGFETIEHLEDCTAYVRLAKRARKWIVLSVPVVPTVGANPHHRRDFEPGELPSLFVDDDWELYQLLKQPSEVAEIYVLRRRT
jgi:hypothetical protein